MFSREVARKVARRVGALMWESPGILRVPCARGIARDLRPFCVTGHHAERSYV